MVGKQAGVDTPPFQMDLKKNLERENQFSLSKENIMDGASVAKQIEWHNFSESRKQQLRKMYPDRDYDSFPDPWDCQPDNPFEDGILGDISSAISSAVSSLTTSASSSLSNASSSISSSLSAARQSVASSISSTQSYLAAQAADAYNNSRNTYNDIASRAAQASVVPSYESTKDSILSSVKNQKNVMSSLSDPRSMLPELGTNSKTMLSALTSTNPMTRMKQGYSAARGGLNVADTRIKEHLPTWDKTVQSGADFLSNHQNIRTVGRTAIAYEPKGVLEHLIPAAAMTGIGREALHNIRTGSEPTLSADRRDAVDIFTGVGEGIYSDFREHAATRTAELGAWYVGGAAIGAAARSGTAASIGGRVTRPVLTVGSKIASKTPQPVKNIVGGAGSRAMSSYRSGLNFIGASDYAAASNAKLVSDIGLASGGAALGAVDAMHSWDRITQPVATGEFDLNNPISTTEKTHSDGSIEYISTYQEQMRDPTKKEMAVRAGGIIGEQLPMIVGMGAGLKRGLNSGAEATEAANAMEPSMAARALDDVEGTQVEVIKRVNVKGDTVDIVDTEWLPASRVKSSEIERFEKEVADNPYYKRNIEFSSRWTDEAGNLQEGTTRVTFGKTSGEKYAEDMNLGYFDNAVSGTDKAQMPFSRSLGVSKDYKVDEIIDVGTLKPASNQRSLADFGYSDRPNPLLSRVEGDKYVANIDDGRAYFRTRNSESTPLNYAKDDTTGAISYNLRHDEGMFELPLPSTPSNVRDIRGWNVRGAPRSSKATVEDILVPRDKGNLVKNPELDSLIESVPESKRISADSWGEAKQSSLFEFGSTELEANGDTALIGMRRPDSTSFFGVQDTSTALRQSTRTRMTNAIRNTRDKVDNLFSSPAQTSGNSAPSYQGLRRTLADESKAAGVEIPKPTAMGNLKLMDKTSKKAKEVTMFKKTSSGQTSGVAFMGRNGGTGGFAQEQVLLTEEVAQGKQATQGLKEANEVVEGLTADMIMGVSRTARPIQAPSMFSPVTTMAPGASLETSIAPASMVGPAMFGFGGAGMAGGLMTESVTMAPSASLELATPGNRSPILRQVVEEPRLRQVVESPRISAGSSDKMFSVSGGLAARSEIMQVREQRNADLDTMFGTPALTRANVLLPISDLMQGTMQAQRRDQIVGTLDDVFQTQGRASVQDRMVGLYEDTVSDTLLTQESTRPVAYAEDGTPGAPVVTTSSLIVPPPLPLFFNDEPGETGNAGAGYAIGRSWIVHNPIYAPKEMLKESKLSKKANQESFFGSSIRNTVDDLF